MTIVIDLPETEETTGSRKDDQAHLWCPVCHPYLYRGMKAICGAELQGIPADDFDQDCAACEADWYPHVLNHALNARD